MKSKRNETELESRPYSKTQDPPIEAAIFIGLLICCLFFMMRSPEKLDITYERVLDFLDIHFTTISILFLSLTLNSIWIGHFFRRFVGFGAQGAKLNYLAADKKSGFVLDKFILFALTTGISFPILLNLRLIQLPISEVQFYSYRSNWGTLLTTLSCSISCGIGSLFIRRCISALRNPFKRGLGIPPVPSIQNGIVLGTIHEEEPSSKPEWISVGPKGLTGNLLITGVIGSGKSQVLLQYLQQILRSFQKRPALLAIDPKRTFVLELKKIIEKNGMQEHLLWIALDGAVKFNPIWHDGMLKQSGFITIANTLKLASINFLGSSGENRFWEQASFNLLKNSLVFCAAKYDYFTFKELYRTLIEAREVSLAGELVDHLSSKPWTPEEHANIEMAIDYFKNEFSQMDQKIRTSILATATGFLSEFLEYRISQLLSPKREEITLVSMTQALRDGKLMLLNIENDALARSVGTLLKLMFQEAVLKRVTHSDHHESRYAVLVIDEYQDVATSGGGAGLGDDRYLAKARESKAVTIAATQSVSSLENAIRSEPATRELLQNFRSRIFGNSTDPKTIRLFQEPRGTEEKKRNSHSISENAQNPTRDLFFGGFGTNKSSLSESISTHWVTESAITAKEFARLKTFEAFAQIFDGLETRFEKLFLKPYFLTNVRTPHRIIMKQMKESLTKMILLFCIHFLVSSDRVSADVLFPNICSVVKTSEFLSCLDFSVSMCMCGWPVPRPCAQISYHVPQTFIEVWPNSKDSFFSTVPGAFVQLTAHRATGSAPFGVDDDQSSYAFQARSIPVPFTFASFLPLPCGETRIDKPCFDLMSEDLGQTWSTGSSDSLQPQFLAWSLAPKACLLKGVAEGIAGIEPHPSLGFDFGGCSYPLGMLPKFPPSLREACNGWGMFFPRSGVYDGASRSIAALMVASRLKSLGVEVSHTIPSGPGETWQMIYPQSSSCFKEGTNPGFLELTQGVREDRRFPSKPNGYLFVVWKKVSCCRDIPLVATSLAGILAIKAACIAVPGGGV